MSEATHKDTLNTQLFVSAFRAPSANAVLQRFHRVVKTPIARGPARMLRAIRVRVDSI